MKTWQDIPGWTCPRLLELYAEEIPKVRDQFVEVGAAYGRSFAYALSLLPKTAVALAVDIWEEHMGGDNLPPELFAELQAYGSPMAVFLQKVRELYPDNTSWGVAKRTSVEASVSYDACSIDFVFLDDRHEYDALSAGLAAWWPKIKRGGLLAGHDYNKHFPGVIQAVKDFARTLPNEARGDTKSNADGWGGTWSILKPL